MSSYKQEDVFTISKEKEAANVKDFDPVHEVVFTLRGQHDYTYQDIPAIRDKAKVKAIDRPEACAKKVGHLHFIKVNNKGELYNPIEASHGRTSKKQQNGLPVWKYHKVPYSTFAHYAHFLQTRNVAFINLARRELGMVY